MEKSGRHVQPKRSGGDERTRTSTDLRPQRPERCASARFRHIPTRFGGYIIVGELGGRQASEQKPLEAETVRPQGSEETRVTS